MEIKLSCPCCGGTNFFLLEGAEIKNILSNEFYPRREYEFEYMVMCKRCKLDRHIFDLEMRIIE